MSLETARIHQSRSLFDIAVRLTDTIGIVGSLALIGTTASRRAGEEVWLAGVMAVAVYFLAAEVTGLFRSWQGVSAEREVTCAAVTWCLTVPVLLTLGLLSGKLEAAQAAAFAGRIDTLVSPCSGDPRGRTNYLPPDAAAAFIGMVGTRAALQSSAPTSLGFNWPATSKARRKWA